MIESRRTIFNELLDKWLRAEIDNIWERSCNIEADEEEAYNKYEEYQRRWEEAE